MGLSASFTAASTAEPCVPDKPILSCLPPRRDSGAAPFFIVAVSVRDLSAFQEQTFGLSGTPFSAYQEHIGGLLGTRRRANALINLANYRVAAPLTL
jgi:hypothetical protein